MKRRTIVIIVAAIVACTVGAGLLAAFVVVPFVMNSGVGESFLAAAALRQAIMASDLVTDANVRFGVNRTTSGTIRTLQVDVRWRGEPESKEVAATRIAKIVLDNYDDLKNVDTLSIGLEQSTSIGVVTYRQNERFAHSPAEWRQRVAGLPV